MNRAVTAITILLTALASSQDRLSPLKVGQTRSECMSLMSSAAGLAKSGKQAISRAKEAADRAWIKRGSLIKERDEGLAELEQGLFCDQCKRPKSQIEREEKVSFEQHLTNVKGKPIRAPQEVIDKFLADMNRKINAETEAYNRAQTEIQQSNGEINLARQAFFLNLSGWKDAAIRDRAAEDATFQQRLSKQREELGVRALGLQRLTGQSSAANMSAYHASLDANSPDPAKRKAGLQRLKTARSEAESLARQVLVESAQLKDLGDRLKVLQKEWSADVQQFNSDVDQARDSIHQMIVDAELGMAVPFVRFSTPTIAYGAFSGSITADSLSVSAGVNILQHLRYVKSLAQIAEINASVNLQTQYDWLRDRQELRSYFEILGFQAGMKRVTDLKTFRQWDEPIWDWKAADPDEKSLEIEDVIINLRKRK